MNLKVREREKEREKALINLNSAISLYLKYLELLGNFDPKSGYSREYILFMLLIAKGKLNRYSVSMAENRRNKETDKLAVVLHELDTIFHNQIIAQDNCNAVARMLEMLDIASVKQKLSECLDFDMCNLDERADFIDGVCDILIRRDGFQLILDQLDNLGSLLDKNETYLQARKAVETQLSEIDHLLKKHATAFKPLAAFVKDCREQFGKAVLDQRRYFWWFLDEELGRQD